MQQASFTSSSKMIYIKRAFAIILILSLLIVSYNKLTFLMNEKGVLGGKVTFYSAKDDYEVLIFGTSHALNTVYTMELYRDYGIRAYNLGEPAERLAMTYYAIKSAVKKHKPKLIMIDTYGLLSKDQKNDPKSSRRCHYTFDGMPLDKIKIEGVLDTVDKEHQREMLIPLDNYHGRWAGLTEKDFTCETFRECAGGCQYINTVYPSNGPTLIGAGKYEWVEDNSTIYMQKIIDFCEEEGIKVLLFNTPATISEEHQQRTNLAYGISERNPEVPYIDLLYLSDEIGIDFQVDDADGVSHVNPMGGRKVTKYLGKYLKEHYDLTDFRNTEKAEQYDAEYTRYCIKSKDALIKETTELTAYLLYIEDEDYSSEIYIRNSAILADEVIAPLLEAVKKNPGVKVETDENITEFGDYSKEEIAAADICVVVTDNVTGGLIDKKLLSK